MENRIKESKNDMSAARTSAATMSANQLRLYLSVVAYTLTQITRQFGLKGTEMSCAQAGTIRTELFKVGALVKVTVRRILISLSSAYPLQKLYERVVENMQAARAGPREELASV